MYILLGQEKGAISPRKAEQLLRANTFEGQRPLSQIHAQNLSQEIVGGKFTTARIALARCSFNGGREVMVNGQHQCHGIMIANKPVQGIVEQYDCPSKEDLWHLFGTFDVHRPRTEGHILKAARGLFKSEALQAVPLRVLSSCGGALVCVGRGTKPNFSARAGNRCRKSELVQEFERDVHAVAKYFTTETSSMMTQPVVTAMIVTHRLNPEKAQEFWERVIYGDNLKRDTPQYILNKKLAGGNYSISKSADTKSRFTAVYSLCICWWNAWRTNTPRNAVKIASMKTIPDAVK